MKPFHASARHTEQRVKRMDKTSKSEVSKKEIETSPIVKCDVCGQQFNRRHLSSHKRLAHGKIKNPALVIGEEAEAVETILKLYGQLSKKSRNVVLKRLTSST